MDLPHIKEMISNLKRDKIISTLKEDKKKFILFSAGSISLVLLIIFSVLYSQTVLVVNIGDRDICCVKNQKMFEELRAELEKRYKDDLGADVEFTQSMETKKVRAFGKEVNTKEECLEKLEAALSVRVKAVGIVIDDKAVAVVKDKDTADKVLNDVKDHYAKLLPGEVVKVEVDEDISLKEKYVYPSNVMSHEDAVAMILQGSLETKTYEIQEGDTLWDIALKENMSLDDLIKANPQLKSEHSLALGDVINLKELIPLLNVTVVKKVTYEEAIPFETEVVKDTSMWKWDKKVKQPGEKGSKEIAAKVTYKNGNKIDHVILGEKITKEPVAQVLAQGTKAEVAYRGSGRFLWPVVGQITSPYGYRGREFHSGIDISCSKGTPIRVANSGTVTFAGWSGGYGNLVIVNHGGGIETYYAHNSSLTVKVGDKVEKGGQVAKAGSTGRSTGTHCHFEIRVNGSTTNPLTYLNK